MLRDVTLGLDAERYEGDELRSLYGWLAAEDELRGRVTLIERDPEPGALGPVADALTVSQAPLVALVGALMAWIRSRYSDVDITVTRSDGSGTRISAKRVSRLRPDQLGPMITQLAGQLETGDQDPKPAPTEPEPDESIGR